MQKVFNARIKKRKIKNWTLCKNHGVENPLLLCNNETAEMQEEKIQKAAARSVVSMIRKKSGWNATSSLQKKEKLLTRAARVWKRDYQLCEGIRKSL